MIRKILLVIGILLAPALLNSHTQALSCASAGEPSKKLVEARDYIFFGTAIGTDTVNKEVKVKITRVLKGNLGTETTLKGTVWDGYYFGENEENLLMFKASQYDPRTNSFQKTDCDYHDSLRPGTKEYVAFVRILEEEPLKSTFWTAGLVAGGISLAITGGIYANYRRSK